MRITAVVAAERIVGFTRGSNAWLQFRGMAATARAINGSAEVEGTHAGVSGIRSALLRHYFKIEHWQKTVAILYLPSPR